MKKLISLHLFFISFFCIAQNEIKVYPSSWWIAMKNPHIQIMVHGDHIGNLFWHTNYPGVKLEGFTKVKNNNYIFLNLTISPEAKPGIIQFQTGGTLRSEKIEFELKQQVSGNGTRFARGIQSADFIYLIMPDRFGNGDPNNDHYANMRDTVVDRRNPLARHGGDLQGVINHLDYIQQLGATAIWLTPVLENDMPVEKEPGGMLSGYHGYWFTDHYIIDKRLGGPSAYLKFVEAVHARGMKVIQDAVYNHIGATHWLMGDPPDSTWINYWPSYQNTSHREQAIFDIHGSKKDKEVMEAGWFVPHLPDLNLRNPLLATYLIQQAIWMTEEYKLDGWRVDTYKYCDPAFLNKLNEALEKEFPNITSLGEATVNSVAAGAYFCRNNLNVAWKSNLSGILDFPVCDAMLDAVNNNNGWNSGVNRLYTTLAEDMLYQNPMNNCIFLDNHDKDRFYSVVGEDFSKFKMGIGLLLTLRGIPHLYYGTEILMKNFKNPTDAMVREDFPGGFTGDAMNKFLPAGRNSQEQAAFEYISKLANFRKSSSALCYGKLMQFIPSKGTYVYFRYDEKQTIMCALNTDSISTTLDFRDFKEMTTGFDNATDIISGMQYPVSDTLNIPARGIMILILKKRPTANKVVH